MDCCGDARVHVWLTSHSWCHMAYATEQHPVLCSCFMGFHMYPSPGFPACAGHAHHADCAALLVLPAYPHVGILGDHGNLRRQFFLGAGKQTGCACTVVPDPPVSRFDFLLTHLNPFAGHAATDCDGV